MKILLLIVGVAVAGFAYLWNKDVSENEIYLIPEHFIGIVTIIFDQKGGMPVKYENGKRLYEIPANGILKTQFKQDFGWQGLPLYYYVDDKNNRKKIPYVIKPDQLVIDTISVYGYHSGKNGNEATRYVDFDMFFVSTKKEADSLYRASEKIYPLELIGQ